MENHPIPQDITGFQFKLIGNMTVKQFAFLAAGVILAWISYILPFPLILRLPLIISFLCLGVGFAFVPVGGRSMDTMFANLVRALFSPTKYLYQKQGGDLLKPSYVVSQPSAMQTPPPVQVQPVIATNPIQTQPQYTPPAPIKEQPTEGVLKEEEQLLASQESVLEEKIEELEPNNASETETLKSMLQETISQKQELEKELESLKSILLQQSSTPPIEHENVQPEVKQAVQEQLPPSEIPHPEAIPSSEPPNLVKGSIKDPRGNPIFNVLVEVLDTEQNPVRALKSNEKGDFSSATSLPNGKYTIKFEDARDEHKFDQINFETNGSPLPPFEVKSIDQREELRRELFN